MEDRKIELRLLTPAVRASLSPYKYQAQVAMVIVRTITGDRGFLHGHEPCSVVLDAGIMRIIPGGDASELKLAIIGGIAQIEDNVLTVITDTAEWPEDIDRARAVAIRDDILNRLDRVDTAVVDVEGLKGELRAAEVLVAVGALPPSGITREK